MLEKVTADLAKCTMGVESPASAMSIFATAFLFLNLAVLTGVGVTSCPPLLLKTNPSIGETSSGTMSDALCESHVGKYIP